MFTDVIQHEIVIRIRGINLIMFQQLIHVDHISVPDSCDQYKYEKSSEKRCKG